MSYTPTTWMSGDTITAAKMNKIEQGIANGTRIITGNFDADPIATIEPNLGTSDFVNVWFYDSSTGVYVQITFISVVNNETIQLTITNESLYYSISTGTIFHPSEGDGTIVK